MARRVPAGGAAGERARLRRGALHRDVLAAAEDLHFGDAQHGCPARAHEPDVAAGHRRLRRGQRGASGDGVAEPRQHGARRLSTAGPSGAAAAARRRSSAAAPTRRSAARPRRPIRRAQQREERALSHRVQRAGRARFSSAGRCAARSAAGRSASSRIRSAVAAPAPGVAATRLTAARRAVPTETPARVARTLSASRRSAGRSRTASATPRRRIAALHRRQLAGLEGARARARPAGLSSANDAPLVSAASTGSSVVIVESRTHCG